ncbi:hypothetical protein [Sansalvadorimonas verongulae]|uniref:hypothetical protein n=1 Tax=Sansalvadorimonas verongulae TaxID=2172824 RepID=UPI0012BBD750|nr:hypothetical protein [Sansalvadorimonas verongulae]MTI15132.1 hypothetical protein [Sansalvadorimonas verongulae]
MPLTREFKETVVELAKDHEFRVELLREAVENYLVQGDVSAGNALLRDYLNATGSFEEVASDLKVHVPSLRRMVSDKGNARSRNLFNVIRVCLAREGINSLQALT